MLGKDLTAAPADATAAYVLAADVAAAINCAGRLLVPVCVLLQASITFQLI